MSNSALYSFIHSKKAIRLVGIILFGAILFFAWNNRISIDDMFFFARTRDAGLKQMVSEQYYNYSGRFVAYALNGFVLFYFNHTMLTIWNLLSIVCFFLAVRFFINSCAVLPKVYGAGWIFLFAALLFGSSHPGEQFFWYTQVNTYLWSATCSLVILGVLNTEKFKVWFFVLLIVCSVFIAGSSENILLQLGLIFTCISIFKWRKFSTKKRLALVFSFLILVIVGFYNVFSPGNQVRSELINELNQTGFFEALGLSVYSYFTNETALISYVWAIPFLIATGFYLVAPVREISLVKATLFYVVLLLVFIAPSAWALREPAPARALITCDLLTVLYLLIVWQKLVTVKAFEISLGYFIGITCLLGTLFIYGIQCDIYSSSYDHRESGLIDESNLTGFHSHPYPLPDCRMYKSATVTTDTNHFSNQHVKMYYRLKGTVTE